MSTSQENILRDYWWTIALFLALMAAWLALPLMPGTGEDAVSIDRDMASSEQSLRSLGASERPGGTDSAAAAAAGGVQGLRLGPARASETLPSAANPAPGTLAHALMSAAASLPSNDDGWGGKVPRSPFGRPRADFSPKAKLSGPGAAAGSRAASANKPFGIGGPDLSAADGADAGAADPAGAAPLRGDSANVTPRRPDLAGSRTFGRLVEAEKAAKGSLAGKDELAANYGRRTFDLAALRAQNLAGMASGGAGVVSGDVPANLRPSDPDLNFKEQELKIPDIGPMGETKDRNDQYMEQQMLMMLLAMALGGIFGPVFGASAVGIAQGMGWNVEGAKKSDVVPNQGPKRT